VPGKLEPVAVLGAGSWGTALACTMARQGREVRIWGRRAEVLSGIRRDRRNPGYLTEVELPRSVHAVDDLGDAVREVSVVIVVPASRGFRAVCRLLAPHYRPGMVVASGTKSLEEDSHLRMTEVMADELPAEAGPHLAALSGPNFAGEVARGLPAGTVVAAARAETAAAVQEVLMTSRFRAYTSTDLVGVELGGALKNVLALAVGIAEGAQLGANAQAALITRGLAEMTRVGVAMGASPLTFAGLSGMGDVVLTCTNDQSRNRRAGVALGRGSSLQEVRGWDITVEGLGTAGAALCLAREAGVEMPITEQLNLILHQDKNPLRAVIDLMTRDARAEAEEFLVTRQGEGDDLG